MLQTNPALLIIDMQEWFFKAEYQRASLPTLLDSINKLADFFHASHLPVVHVLTVHEPNTNTRDAEESRGTHRWQEDIVIFSTEPGAFTRTGLEDRLWELDVNTVVLAGFSVDDSVGLTAIDAYERDFMPILAGEAISGLEQDMLRKLESGYGIVPVSNERVKEILGEK